ncbi:MAG: hypothetical protein GF383_03295 [Candidatus Lokiarchaeota archaeon]|nr:hypothetical protein [Candidatus Lokiarchaeota archaeon]MBD3338642.1 hypothetical protein [Candidatus Lokiarchaeota archaeon]
MALTQTEILNGVFSIVCVVISTIIGVIIASRYIKYKQRTLLLVGITWIGLFSPWWPSSISFLLIIFTGSGLSAPMYFFLGNFVAPVILLIWIIALTDLKYKNSQNLLILIYASIGAAFEITFIYFLINDPYSIGVLSGNLDVTYRGIVLFYAIFIVINMLITGILFGKESLKSSKPEIKLKGYFLIAAFVSWCIGAVMDAALPLTAITLTIARLILISSALEFYLGFVLPDFVKKVLIKSELD